MNMNMEEAVSRKAELYEALRDINLKIKEHRQSIDLLMLRWKDLNDEYSKLDRIIADATKVHVIYKYQKKESKKQVMSQKEAKELLALLMNEGNIA